MKPPRRLLISFSGGETSAYMTWLLLREHRDEWDEIAVVFANTGQESEETLEFVRDCDERMGFPTVWIEAVQHHGERKAAGFRVVDFATADRSGAVFEDMILKYGIPNTKFKHCTRSLKRIPIEAYAKSLGWARSSYVTAIGIRADEIDRQSEARDGKRLAYPLIKLGVTKPKVNAWWQRQNFRLRLKGYQGNCRWCWKKSFRKLITIMRENPAAFDFPRRMEALYGHEGPEFRHDPATRESPLPVDYRRTFFRENSSVADIEARSAALGDRFVPAPDDATVYPDPDLFDQSLDLNNGCEESCEVFADEDELGVEA